MSANLIGLAGEAAAPILERRGPMGVVGRAIGLGPEELDAGVPGWAWLGVGLVAGVVAGYSLHDRLEAFIKR